MPEDLSQIEPWAAALLAKLQPAERRRLTRRVAQNLRRAQQQRITEQRNPDGSSFEPRKPQRNLRKKAGRVRRKMFVKLKTGRHLKVRSDASRATVLFSRTSAPIARIHQYGLRARVNRQGTHVAFPERRLLGLSTADREQVIDTLLDHITN